MDRRDLFKSALVTLTAVAADTAVAATTGGAPRAQKVVYHLSELDRVQFVLGNIRNHMRAIGAGLDLALVVHGPPLRAFRDETGSATKDMVAAIKADRGRLYACIHTMEGMKITLADLLPGFEVADKGGVVKLTELQNQGYAYLRP